MLGSLHYGKKKIMFFFMICLKKNADEISDDTR